MLSRTATGRGGEAVAALALLLALVAAPTSLSAAPTTEATAAAATTPAITVGVLRFTGPSSDALDLRHRIADEARRRDYNVVGISLEIDQYTAKLACEVRDDACLARLAASVRRQHPAIKFLVYGKVAPPDLDEPTWVTIFDVDAGAPVEVIVASPNSDDLLLPLVLPRRVVSGIDRAVHPPGPLTAEELALLAELEENNQRPPSPPLWVHLYPHRPPPEPPPPPSIEPDLRRDFPEWCRIETRRQERAQGRTPTPAPAPYCKNGPYWGYFRPRTWVAFSLAAAGLVATSVAYGLGGAAHRRYRDARGALADSGLVNTAPTDAEAYTALASAVVDAGEEARVRLLAGDLSLAATTLALGVFAVVVRRDRVLAKRYIREMKYRRYILTSTRLRLAPSLTPTGGGAGLSIRF